MSFNFMAAVTICSDFAAQRIKSLTISIVSPSICHEVIGPDAIIFAFRMLSFRPAYSPISPPSRGSLAHLCFQPLEWYHSIAVEQMGYCGGSPLDFVGHSFLNTQDITRFSWKAGGGRRHFLHLDPARRAVFQPWDK